MDSAGENQTVPTPSDNAATRHAEIASALPAARSAETCLALASEAEGLGDLELQRTCLEHAIALDRNCQTALLTLAAVSLDQGDRVSTAVLLEESARISPLPADIEPLRSELLDELVHNHDCEAYLQAIGHIKDKPEKLLTILVVTNLFPPQELGGYGRMMWEFANGLVARGHTVRVLTSDVTDFGKVPTADESAMEQHVLRTLNLAGTWVEGRGAVLKDHSEIARRQRDNLARVRTAVGKLGPDLVLAGNLDLLGIDLLRAALDRGIPVLHALANAAPGYSVAAQPNEPYYWVAPCSDWNGEVLKQGGFAPARCETLYPGARVDRFFRFFLPDTARLRICFASLVMPYKGADTLVQALVLLHQAGVDFTAEIAGDSPDAGFLSELKQVVSSQGLDRTVQFTGFLDRPGLAALFARNNVLVFPSRFEEPFGISQVEALAAGLVVVSSGTGGAKEIVRDGVDGLLFPAGDAKALAERLWSLAKDTRRAASLQRSGQARAMVFSVDQAVHKIELLAGEMQASIEALQLAEQDVGT